MRGTSSLMEINYFFLSKNKLEFTCTYQKLLVPLQRDLKISDINLKQKQMEKTIKLLQTTDWDKIWLPENGNKPKEWKAFCRAFKSELSKMLKDLGCTNLKFTNGFFEITVFMTAPQGQMWYIHLSDVRFTSYHTILYRRVTSYTDYTGGGNEFAPIEELKDHLSWRVK